MAQTPKTVLVVDDDENIVELLSLFIDGDHFRSIGVTSAQDAIRLAGQISPAVVLCDWSMPEMDGPEMILRLRANPQTAALKIVLMSGYLPPDLDAIGADGFLSKPFTPDDVLQAVTAAAA